MPGAAFLAVFALMLSAVCWFGLADPNLVPGFFDLPWPNSLATTAAAGTVFALLFVPLVWMLLSHRADFSAIWLMQNGLLAGGYFFLPETAYTLNLPDVASGILNASGAVAIVNALGFFILLVTLGLTSLVLRLARATVNPLPNGPEICDRRLLILLRLAVVVGIAIIILSMAISRTVPMLASDPVAARYAFTSNAVMRPLFNLNMAILPFAAGGLLILFARKPGRLFGLDGCLAAVLLAAQFLSGDRFPLAVAAMVFIALMSMEKKRSRSLLFVAVAGYFVLFVGLSGLTSIWRQNRDALSSKDPLLAASFRQAYTGDNLIDYRDAAWVFSQWDRQPLLGITYGGGLVEMLPSAIFPQKKQWHLGKVALRIVGWEEYDQHYGLRLSCFGESFLNFGFAGVVGMGLIFGIMLGTLSRYLALLSNSQDPPCLARNLSALVLTEMLLVWGNSSDVFMFWALLALLLILKLVVFRDRRKPVFRDRRQT